METLSSSSVPPSFRKLQLHSPQFLHQENPLRSCCYHHYRPRISRRFRVPICWPPPRCAQRACGIQTGRQGENDGSLIEFLRHPLKVFAPWKWKTRVAYRKKLLQPDDVAHERAATQLFAITNVLELFFFSFGKVTDLSDRFQLKMLLYNVNFLALLTLSSYPPLMVLYVSCQRVSECILLESE